MSDAARNRAEFPVCAAFLDEMREVFGPDVRMVWVREAGQEMGRANDPAGVPVSVDRMVLSKPAVPEKNRR